MKLSYRWLKEFVDFDQTPKEIAELITFLGIEANLLSSTDHEWVNIITAKVLETAKHPQADKLTICMINDGNNTYSVICGAPNVAPGQIIALAQIGAELPGGLKIKKAKIRGVESEGMICSGKELGLAEESSGIMVLPADTLIGKPLKEVLGNNDSIIEIEIPTNRPDALSHWGIAREIAAKLKKQVIMPALLDNIDLPQTWKNISILEPELCSRYIGIKIKGIKVGPSPDWMADRLNKCGIRPINNIVDITNYVLLELGHPLHAFDFAKIKGGEIVVRRARNDESILALDGKYYKLNENILVIADTADAQAIAGVMGGESSGVQENTKDIILESAVFKPQNIRKTSKALNLSTDASYRFERGTGWTVAEKAVLRATKLICEIAGGYIESKYDNITKPYVPNSIVMRYERARKITGIDFNKAEISDILARLGLQVSETNDSVSALIPSWRGDLLQEIDLVEEVARIKGYELVPITVMPVTHSNEKIKQDVFPKLRERLLSLGFSEAVNCSFAEEKELTILKLAATVKVANPMSKENEVMRPSMLVGLWRNLILNLRQGIGDIKLFESGTVFGELNESRKVGVISCGQVWRQWWGWEGKAADISFDYYYFGGMINNILSGNRIKFRKNPKCAPYFHPGKTSIIELNGRAVGEIGILHPELSNEAGKEICYSEFDLDLLENAWNHSEKMYKPISRKPMVNRDISLLAKKDIPYDSIISIIEKFGSAKGGCVSDYELFSKYEDEKIGPDHISYSFHLVFRHSESTLTDAEVNTQFDIIVAALNKELGITLR